MARDGGTLSERRAVLRRAAHLAGAAGAVTGDHAAAVAAVRQALRPIQDALTERELQAIPAARLKDVTEGRLRLNAIEAAGYRTVAQVLSAGPYRLRHIPGVGPQTADQAVAAAGQIARAVQEAVTVRIDVEHRDPATTALLVALYRLVEAGAGVRRTVGTAEALARELEPLLRQSAPATRRLRWWLLGRAAREQALSATARLRAICEQAEQDGLLTLLAQTSVDLLRSPADEIAAWVDFEVRSADYYGLLAELSGRDADPAATEGFLPSEVAERVREQPLDDRHLRVSLRGYQSFGARFALAQRRVVLGDEMGLGKTIQAIAALAHLAARGETHFLVVCPAGVLVNWTREINSRSALRALPLHGPDRRDAFADWRSRGGVGITTYDALRGFAVPVPGFGTGPGADGAAGDGTGSGPGLGASAFGAGGLGADSASGFGTGPVPGLGASGLGASGLGASGLGASGLGASGFGADSASGPGTPRAGRGSTAMLVVDEAHYVKNPETRRAQAVAAWAVHCERVLFLTGTPMENRVAEFRSLVRHLQPDLLPEVEAADGVAGSRAFRAAVAPAYLRRNQEDVLTELPSLVRTDEWQELSAADQDAYREAVAAGNFMAMRRAAFAHPETSAKLRRLRELVADAAGNGRKVVVFSYFRDVLAAVEQALGPTALHGPLTGSVTPVRRQALVDEFTAAPGHAVLLAQIEAGGVGLNLQAASVVIICEPQLKPTVEHQAVARAHRMGQVRPVHVHRLLATTGVDQRLLEILQNKSRLFDAYARRSDVAEAVPDAVDVSDGSLARRIVEEEQQRLGRAGADVQPA